MTGFLFVVSFIIDGVLLWALLTVMKKVKQAEELELKQKQVASEIEDLFTSYLLEIKEENLKMYDWAKENNTGEETVSSLKKKENRNTSHLYITSAYTPPASVKETKPYEPSIHSQVFNLKQEG